MLLPNKKYDIIYADPPWSFKNYSKKGEEKNANQHYNCMSIKDICNLPVKNISKDNNTFFWSINNVFDKSYERPDGYNKYDRTFNLGFRRYF